MIGGRTILAIIPARGGSKGIPKKNLHMLAGKPLIAWTIEEAKKSKYLDRLILSSEDAEIIAVAKKWGCEVPFVRPLELAADDTPGIEPVLHALDNLKNDHYDYVMLLQPTSPLRRSNDIDNCIEHFVLHKVPACVSVVESEQNPCWMFSLDQKGNLKNLTNLKKLVVRRQELPKYYALNGALYIAKVNWLKEKRTFITEETLAFIMPRGRSIDVDSSFEMDICEYLLLKVQ